jgi:hypothetical protein
MTHTTSRDGETSSSSKAAWSAAGSGTVLDPDGNIVDLFALHTA